MVEKRQKNRRQFVFRWPIFADMFTRWIKMVNGFTFTEFKISPCTVSSTLYRDQSTECRSTYAYRWPVLTTAWPLVGLFSLFNGLLGHVFGNWLEGDPMVNCYFQLWHFNL